MMARTTVLLLMPIFLLSVSMRIVFAGTEKSCVTVHAISLPKETTRTTTGTLQAVIRNMAMLQYEARRMQEKDPESQGILSLRLSIAPNGTVASCSAESTSVGSGDFHDAVVKRVLKWPFGESAGQVKPCDARLAFKIGECAPKIQRSPAAPDSSGAP